MGVELKNIKPPLSRRLIYSNVLHFATNSRTLTAGRVYFSSITIPEDLTVSGVSIPNAATVAGNLYAGLYREVTAGTAEGAELIATTNSTAQGTASLAQKINFTSKIILTKGNYYLAIEESDSSSTMYGASSGGIIANYAYFVDRAGGYGALPAIATGVTATNVVQLLAVLMVV